MSPSATPGALTLDVWYTLLYQTRRQRREYEAARSRAWSEPLEEAGMDPAAAGEAVVQLLHEARRRDRKGIPFPVPVQVAWLRRQTGVRPSADGVSSRLDLAVEASECEVARGAFEMIDRMRSTGARLALVSNVLYENPGPMRQLLARTGLTREIPVVVLSSEVGAMKPSPRPILVALEKLRVPAKDSLHIGDRPGDVRSAWRAGGSAVLYAGLRRFWPAGHGVHWTAALRRVPRLDSWSRLTERSLARWWAASRAARPGPRRSSRQGSA